MPTEQAPPPTTESAAHDDRARKRAAIGLAPQRPTAKDAPQRPPGADDPRGCLWSAVLALVSLVVVTSLLVAARVIDAPTTWPAVRNQLAGWLGVPAMAEDPAALRLLRADEFSHPDSLLQPNIQAEQWSLQVAADAGAYQMRVYPSHLAWSTVGVAELHDFYIEAGFTVADVTPAGFAGLVARYRDRDNFYLFAVDGMGQFQVQLLEQGTLQALTPWLPDMAVNPAGEANILALEDDGELVRFFVNGLLFFVLAEPTLPPGDVGVFGAAPAESFGEIDVDWLHLYALPQG